MKKLIAFVLCMAVICTLSVTAFAAESPSASAKVSVTLRKADGEGTVEKSDIAYTIDNGGVVTVKSNADYGKFNSWSIYKGEAAAVEGTDYKIVSGSLNSAELKIEVFADVVICANYNGAITDPDVKSDSSATSPETGDFAVASMAVVMLVAAAVVFGAKKQFSK